MKRLKYKKVFYAWPQIGDSDVVGASWAAVRITIESSHHTFPDDEIPEIIETLNIMMDCDFKTKEELKKEKEALNKYISEYQKQNHE